MFNFFEELFAPGRKHAAEEQKRLELTRVDLGIGDPGRGPIDLASGKVIVRTSGTDRGSGGGGTDADGAPGKDERSGAEGSVTGGSGAGTDGASGPDVSAAPGAVSDARS
ncbi:DUF6191 domain-containing protein [Streptomyces sp. NPDC047515]|uniref:DUF6191 domain-containing protein n=1 Tax=Streptomyces sp. NPDC047515 TaxID=3155380 RepID=UPI0033CA08A8